jgi:hypothetical protein
MRPKTLGQDIFDAGCFEYGSNRSPGNHSGSLRGRFKQNPAGRKMTDHLVGNRGVQDIDFGHIFLRSFDTFSNRLRDLIGLAQAETDGTFAVSDHNDGRKGKTAAAFDHLGHAVDVNNLVDKSLFFGFAPIQNLSS